MSAPLDVLAVMNFHISQLCVESPEDQKHLDSMTEARAAVAELVEAARGLAADKYLSDPINADRMAPLNAALAKFGGAA